MSDFFAAIDKTLQNEGEAFVPEDRGRGASKWGITRATYAESHPGATDEDIKNLSRYSAVTFYLDEFWNRYHIGLIEDQELAAKIFDLAVNIGPATVIKILQTAVYARVRDGILGPETAAQVNGVNGDPPSKILEDVQLLAAAHYRSLVAGNPALSPELPGWLARLNS